MQHFIEQNRETLHRIRDIADGLLGGVALHAAVTVSIPLNPAEATTLVDPSSPILIEATTDPDILAYAEECAVASALGLNKIDRARRNRESNRHGVAVVDHDTRTVLWVLTQVFYAKQETQTFQVDRASMNTPGPVSLYNFEVTSPATTKNYMMFTTGKNILAFMTNVKIRDTLFFGTDISGFFQTEEDEHTFRKKVNADIRNIFKQAERITDVNPDISSLVLQHYDITDLERASKLSELLGQAFRDHIAALELEPITRANNATRSDLDELMQVLENL